MTEFLEDRKRAFTKAILYDDWSYVKEYCKKYGIPIHDNERVMKAGVYKAVHECTDIEQEVKDIAIEKCMKLGFYPFLMERRNNDEKEA